MGGGHHRPVWSALECRQAAVSIGNLIGYYIGKSGVASAYGAAASIITLLLWIYYSSLILLFGAEFTKAYAESGAVGPRSLRGEEHQT